MAVYVDDMEAPYGRMIMCHMAADTTAELLEMADRIGVDRRWIQKRGTIYEHFDISKGKKQLALEAGAILLSRRDFVRWMLKKRRGEAPRRTSPRKRSRLP